MNPREIFSTTKNKFPSKIMKSIYISYTGAEIGTDVTRNAWWNDIVKVETRFPWVLFNMFNVFIISERKNRKTMQVQLHKVNTCS